MSNNNGFFNGFIYGYISYTKGVLKDRLFKNDIATFVKNLVKFQFVGRI